MFRKPVNESICEVYKEMGLVPHTINNKVMANGKYIEDLPGIDQCCIITDEAVAFITLYPEMFDEHAIIHMIPAILALNHNSVVGCFDIDAEKRMLSFRSGAFMPERAAAQKDVIRMHANLGFCMVERIRMAVSMLPDQQDDLETEDDVEEEFDYYYCG